MCANNRVHHGLMVAYDYLHITLLHYHHYADLSEGVELLKLLSDIFCLECVSEIRSISQLAFVQYMGLCVFSLPIYLMMSVRISVLDFIIIIKSEVSPIFHCWGFGNELMVCAACLSIFLYIVCLKCLLYHILSLIGYTFRENQNCVFITIVHFMMYANSRIRFGLQIVFVCLYITPSHYQHCANLSENIELIKCLPDIFCRVCE